jgi:quercetin dioxygenase-like cupin family protein
VTTASSIDAVTLGLDGASGAIWSLGRGGDLDANVVVLHVGDSVDAHVNNEVDVLLVGVTGAGTVIVDGASHPVRAGVLVHIPKHATRAIAAVGNAPFVYVTVHHARPGLGVRPRR